MIPYGRHEISQADIDAVVEVLRSDFLTQGPMVPRFEESVAQYCGAQHAVAANSATSALHIACLALDLGPGEKLYEELLIGDNPKPTQHPRIMKAHEQFLPWPALEQKLNTLSIAMSANDVPVIRALLKDLVSGYQPTGEVVDWVHLAMQREAVANE